MTTEDKLKWLFSNCVASTTIKVNPHRDFYQTVEQYCNDMSGLSTSEEIDEEIGRDIFIKMNELNTFIEIQSYPISAIGSYTVYHYDFDQAVHEIYSLIITDYLHHPQYFKVDK